jgi:hypothetical protein
MLERRNQEKEKKKAWKGDLQKSPNSVPFASASTSVSCLKVLTITTGPNISSLYASDFRGTFNSMVGSIKEPFAALASFN